MLKIFEEKGWRNRGCVMASRISTLPGVNQTVGFLSGPVTQNIVPEERRVGEDFTKGLYPTQEHGNQLASCLSTTSCQSGELSIQNERGPSGRTVV